MNTTTVDGDVIVTRNNKGQMVKETHPDGTCHEYEYHENGAKSKHTFRDGTFFEFDINGNIVKLGDTSGYYCEREFHPNGTLAKKTCYLTEVKVTVTEYPDSGSAV